MSCPRHGGAALAPVYQPKTYRHWVSNRGLVSFSVIVKETDLFISATSGLEKEALKAVRGQRALLEGYIESHPLFATSLEPLPVASDAPPLVREMAEAAARAGVGPMAAVAGAIAELVGRELLPLSPEVIVENGGDIFLKTSRKRLVGLYAGESALSGKLAFEVWPEETPLGVCTSSGSVGHSLSMGKADAVVVFSPSAAVADAAATAIGNRVQSADDIAAAVEFARTIEGVGGVVIVVGDHLGLWGQVRIARV